MTESKRGAGEECPNCGLTNLERDWEDIDAVCSTCGFVIQSFAHPEENTVPHDGWTEENTEDKQTCPWDEYYTVTNSTEQQMASAFAALEQIADVLHLSNEVREQSSSLFAKAAKENLVDGRRTKLVVATTLYLAARKAGCPRPLARIAEVIDTESGEVDRLARSLRSELELEYTNCGPRDYLSFLVEELDYDERTEIAARDLIEDAQCAGITNGKSPTGVAGAALYVVGDEEDTQQEVATTAGVTKETIRLRLKEFQEEGLIHA